jgi:leucyl-tRNA synthetase
VDHWAPAVRGARSAVAGGDASAAARALRRKTHDTIRRVTVDIEERMHLNTAVSSLMELVNELYLFSQTTVRGVPAREDSIPSGTDDPSTLAVLKEAIDALVAMVSPFAPHTAEELWHMLGHEGGLAATRWPAFDAALAQAEELVVPVQVNGKVRARLTVPAGLSDDELEARALADTGVRSYTEGKTIRKVVVAKGSLISVVVS